MPKPNEQFRPDLAGRAKEAFAQNKEKVSEAQKPEIFKSELDKWKKPRLELKPEGNGREAIDRRAFAESLHVEAENALGRSEQPAQAVSETKAEPSISDLSGAEMAKALIESYNRSVMAESEPGLER